MSFSGLAAPFNPTVEHSIHHSGWLWRALSYNRWSNYHCMAMYWNGVNLLKKTSQFLNWFQRSCSYLNRPNYLKNWSNENYPQSLTTLQKLHWGESWSQNHWTWPYNWDVKWPHFSWCCVWASRVTQDKWKSIGAPHSQLGHWLPRLWRNSKW